MATTLIRSLYNITPEQQGGVMTIGNFDGVHRGHQRLLERVVAEARERNVPALVVTFEPHPFEFFMRHHVTISRLTRLREKFCALADCGIDHVLVIPFTQQIAKISAIDFVKTILVEKLRTTHIVIGDDFHFGYQRQGDYALLQQMSKPCGFTVEAMPSVLLEGERVSSTGVRKALAEGDHVRVERLLGHPYAMMGRVRAGDQLGRQLGFPTANIYLHRQLTPVKGIYIVIVHGISARPWPGVANVGTRPTVDGTRTLLEVHLLGFNQDIYGRYVRVEFCQKIRDEERYPTLDLLKKHIAQDVIVATQYFKKIGML